MGKKQEKKENEGDEEEEGAVRGPKVGKEGE